MNAGSSGIGLELCQRLASKGCRVAIWDVQPPLHDILSDTVRFYKCDVTNKDLVKNLAAQVKTELGRVTILVNNAGIVYAKSLLDLEDQQIERTINVNFLSHFWTTRAVLPDMMESRYGHIMTVSSTLGMFGAAKMTDYCSSKFGAYGFHESLRGEIRTLPFKHLIHTSLICPNLILTGMFSGIKIRLPFFIPPLQPSEVVDQMMQSLERTVYIDTSLNASLVNHVKPAKILEQLKDDSSLSQLPLKGWSQQHKVVWMPLCAYAPVVMRPWFSVDLFDLVSQVVGTHDAITEAFSGRKRA